MFWASTVGRSLQYFLKTSQVFGVTLGRYNSELCSEIQRVFCVSPMQGNTEHSTFFFKNGTSDTNTIILGTGIRSTIIHTNFY
jgi:hypothetical protein